MITSNALGVSDFWDHFGELEKQLFRVLEVAYDGESANDAEDEKYEHRGIARRSFRTQLPLTEHWEVTGAFCEDGILTVNLHRLVPEEKKPKTIQIH